MAISIKSEREIELMKEAGVKMTGAGASAAFALFFPAIRIAATIATTANAPELGEALCEMQIDEVRAVRSAYGIHILKRVATDPDNYNKDESAVNNITSALKNKLYPEIIARYTPQIVANGDIIGKYTMASAQMP